MKNTNCNETEIYFKYKYKMCEEYGGCLRCLFKENLPCVDFEIDNTKEAIKIVQEYANKMNKDKED